MNAEFTLLLKLFSFAASGISCCDGFSEDDYELIKNADMKNVQKLAIHCACGGMVNLALQDLYSISNPEISHKLLEEIKFRILRESAVNEEISHLFSVFQKENIKAALLKGRAVGRFYAVPECRESSDTDILVSKDDEKKALEIMERLGYKITPRTYYSHHSTAFSSKSGTIELHISLFYDMLYEVLFGKYDEEDLIKEDFIEVNEQGKKYYTLGITDHIIFLTLHAVQHFIRSGTSVRQIYDILIYTKACRNSIDFDRYFEILDSLGYRGFINSFYAFGVKYFGFKTEDFPTFEIPSENTLDAFVRDVVNGGYIGKNRDDGGELFRHYGQTKAQDKEKYKKYLKNYQKKRILSSIFPERNRLTARFPFAKNPLLLPVGWVAWLFYGLKIYKTGQLDGKVKSDDFDAEQKQRLDLFSDLGL